MTRQIFGRLTGLFPICISGSFQPGLKHQNDPELISPLSFCLEMFVPLLPDGIDIKESLPVNQCGIEQRFSPISQRTSKPLAYGKAEAHLGPLNQARRDV